MRGWIQLLLDLKPFILKMPMPSCEGFTLHFSLILTLFKGFIL
jgi:hypothetical protein